MFGLQIKDICYSYKKGGFALNNIDIVANKGEILCLLGPSGCGKSTILRLVAGLGRLQRGSIIINDRIVSDEKRIVPIEKRNISLIFQHPSLFHHQTVIENVIFATPNSITNKKKYALEVLETMEMQDYADMYPHSLSGGQQQLATIARTLAQQGDVVLLDEPFSNLDSLLKAEVRNRVLAVLRERNITALLVTHDPLEALDVADKIYIMRNGIILQHGTPQEIYSNPYDATIAQFFGEVNIIHGTVSSSGGINTPFGFVDTTGFPEGSKVLACVRPDAITLDKKSEVKGNILNIKFFNNMIYMDVAGYRCWMQASSANPAIVKGNTIRVALDTTKVMLFQS